MNHERLLRLADLLEADAGRVDGIKFNLGCLVQPDVNGTFLGLSKVKLDCGTQACAVGLAALTGAFEAEGLTYTLDNGCFEPVFAGEECEWDWAAEKLFEIEANVVTFLFTIDGYWAEDRPPMTGASAEREVAQRIRDLVAGKVDAPPRIDEDAWEDE